MKNLKMWIMGAAILTSAAIAVPLLLHADGEGHGRVGRRHGMHRMLGGGPPLISIALKHQSELNLTADQITNLENTRSHYRTRMEPVIEQLKSVEGEIVKLLQESPADLIQVKLKIQEAEKFRAELRYQRIEALENGKTLLSLEQREQLKNILTARRSRHLRYHRHHDDGQAS